MYECCCFFLILSEKYARYYYDLLLLLYVFALIGFFSFTFLSILDFLLLTLNMLLHYYESKNIREIEKQSTPVNPLLWKNLNLNHVVSQGLLCIYMIIFIT